MYSMAASARLELGVMGYQASTVRPPNIRPIPAAWLPSMTILPAVAELRSRVCAVERGRLSRAQAWPATAASVLSLAAVAFLANWRATARFTSSMSMPSRWATTPT